MNLREELIQVAAVAVAAVLDIDTGSTSMGQDGEPWPEEHELIMMAVFEERIAQEAKWGERHLNPLDWIMILAEEIGESVDEVDWDHVPDHHDPTMAHFVQCHLSIAGEMAHAWLEAKQP